MDRMRLYSQSSDSHTEVHPHGFLLGFMPHSDWFFVRVGEMASFHRDKSGVKSSGADSFEADSSVANSSCPGTALEKIMPVSVTDWHCLTRGVFQVFGRAIFRA